VYSEKKTADDGQRNCPNHVEFYSKNKFEKLVHLIGFIIRVYHDARSPERQNNCSSSGGLYKQLTIFFIAFYEESVRCHDTIDTQRLDSS